MKGIIVPSHHNKRCQRCGSGVEPLEEERKGKTYVKFACKSRHCDWESPWIRLKRKQNNES